MARLIKMRKGPLLSPVGVYNDDGRLNCQNRTSITTPVGVFAPSGSFNVTVVDGTSYVGRYAPNGSMNVIFGTGEGTHPCGAMYVDTPLGDELVRNGTFTSTNYWTNADETFATLTTATNQLTVTSINSATGTKAAYQIIPVIPGATYTFNYNFVSENTVGQVRLGNSVAGQEYHIQSTVGATEVTGIVPTVSEIYITLMLASTQASGSTAVFSDISIVRTA